MHEIRDTMLVIQKMRVLFSTTPCGLDTGGFDCSELLGGLSVRLLVLLASIQLRVFDVVSKYPPRTAN